MDALLACNVVVDECFKFSITMLLSSTIMLVIVFHYASICSYASILLLCSKLCQHNSPRPNSDDAPITSKCPKLDQTMREDRIKDLEEDNADISSHIAFKEECRMQAETVKNYKTCDELTQEILECKGRKRELEKQLKLLLLKDKCSKRRKNRLQESDSRSRSTTPMLTTPPTTQTPSSPLSPTWVQLSDKEEVTRSSTQCLFCSELWIVGLQFEGDDYPRAIQ